MFKRKKEEPEWDQEYEPLMKVLLKQVKTKSASEVGRKKVDYFRGRDFKKMILGNEELMKKRCSAALKATLEGKPATTEKDVERLGAELISRNFCYRAMYKPLNPTSKTDSGTDKKTKKWPDRLARSPQQSFDCEGFYVITYEGGNSLQHFLLALIIVGVLLVCMFPVWPMWAKIGIWYLSVIFLSLYFGLLILRLLLYTMFWIVGFDFWILPNINDEMCGFLDSFQPLYSWEKRKDDALMLLVRFGSLAIVGVAIEQISQTHSLADVKDFVTTSYIDVIDWGVDKLTLPSTDRQLLPSLEQMEKDAADDLNGTSAADAMDAEADDDDDVIDVDAK
eukprot:gnl/TRDRNA2_/TRDRNA2_179001_c0_seq1.p1 gnl/TRDRNA2_/TRDRNA2_179001_c0~~gnl/TRDRNA2_/TRDRNA2_179001_c0_seq1.p1  ORF type:complete len:336 (+),score=98.39 gnl/TRDRNA2_/TRDRNA2_179001_c0_seq1:105-1112(+)